MKIFQIDENLSRKEKEKLFKKHEIMYSALKLFSEKGFVNTKLDEIAEAAEFGKGTIYNYFKNKEEIYSEILTYIMNNYHSNFEDIYAKTNTLRELVEHQAKFMFTEAIENPEEFLLILRLKIQTIDLSFVGLESIKKNVERIRELYTQRIKKAISTKEIESVNPLSVMFMLQGLFVHYILNMIQSPEVYNIDSEKESIFLTDVIFNGINNRSEKKN